jgi:hypothetical protein
MTSADISPPEGGGNFPLYRPLAATAITFHLRWHNFAQDIYIHTPKDGRTKNRNIEHTFIEEE